MAAVRALEAEDFQVLGLASLIESAPIGPSLRRYANGAALVETTLAPEECLTALKSIERDFGRRSGGLRWSARVLDLDIVLWSGGTWHSPRLTIPHPRFRTRDFVLVPALRIARTWRDPLTNLTIAHLAARLTRRRAPRR